MRLRLMYGWQTLSGHYAISKIPPDLPQARAKHFASIAEAEQEAMEKKSTVIWSGPALLEKRWLEQGQDA